MNHEFTIEDIKRYVAGRMTPAEMHRIEKAALEDPFLADAIEGVQYAIENYGEETFDSSTEELRKRIRDSRTNDTRSIAGIWWKAAAVIVVLVTAVAIIYFMNSGRNDQRPSLAKVERFEADTPATAATPKKQEEQIVSRAEEKAAGQKLPDDKEKKPAQESRVAAKQPTQRKTLNEERGAAKKDADETTEPMLQKREVIVSQDKRETHVDTPIIANEKALSQADVNDTLQRALQGRAAGVVVQRKRLPEAADTPDFSNAELSEVVVVGYAANNKNKGDKSSRVTPEGGWKSFDEYINNNKRINSEDSLKRGTEEISFDIDSEGAPVNFKIIRSLSPAHDNEAVRLLKEGPAWNVKKGKRKLRLRIRF